MSTASPCRLLEWDSEFFGKRIATLDAAGLDRERMRGALEWCRAHAIDCLYMLVGSDDAATDRLAAEAGFVLVDVRVTMDLKLDAQHERAAVPPGKIRASTPADIPALRAIAAGSHTTSRFYWDGHFDARLCGELYATWIEKSCRGRSDVVLVAEHDGRQAGYLALNLREGRRGEMMLFGISPHARGHGLGTMLVASALGWFAGKGCEHVGVATQARSVEAQRIYQKLGFRTVSVQSWHHRWFDPPFDNGAAR